MEPTQHEAESRKVAGLLVYALKCLGRVPPRTLVEVSRATYGDKDQVHELTEQLCTLCGDMSPTDQARVIYDGKNPEARKLADWWDAHQRADREREQEERETKHTEAIRKRALAKLTAKERAALGL